MNQPRHTLTQQGAALLVAMLMVALVATLAATAMWQQWRGIALETAERQTSQAQWLLQGAMGWARVILREDANAGANSDGSDNLQEPWAIPLQPTPLSTFVASLPDSAGAVDEDPLAQKVLLAGQITDLQGRLNLQNLIHGGQLDPRLYRSLERLFAVLGLPPTSLDALSQGLISAQQGKSGSLVLPQYVSQLSWLGLNAQQLNLLAPHVTLLPQTTPLNVNTASALALYAAIPALSLSQAQDLVNRRQNSHWSSVNAFLQSAGLQGMNIDTSQLSTQTSYFEVQGSLRIDDQIWHQRCLLWRSGGNVTSPWCERGQWAHASP